MKLCPHCQSARVRLSHRSKFEAVLCALMGTRYYRCLDCDWRGMRFSNRKPSRYSSKASKRLVVALYLLAIIAAVFIAIHVGSGGDAPPPPPPQ